MIVRLGSGEAARRGCGPKAGLLDQAARAGLPVPPGVVVLDEGWRSAVARGLVRLEGAGKRQSVSVPDPTLLAHILGLPAFEALLAVRSAFSVEDAPAESLAGAFVTGLFVDGRHPPALAAGLAGVWASALGRPRGVRRDVIIQDMVIARRAGVVFTEREHEDDLVNATEGTAEDLLAGRVPGEAYTLPKRRGRERATEEDPASARLQVLLRDLRRVLGEGDWDVEWADDGNRVWLVQVRAVSRPTRRDELLTPAHHRDILPDPPSRFTSSLIAARADRLFDLYRGVDPGLPARRPLVELHHGRPFANLSLLREVLRRWGLPTALVTESMGVSGDREWGVQPGRVLRGLRVLFRLGRLQAGAVSTVRRTSADLRARAALPPTFRLGEAVEELGTAYVTLARGMLLLATAASPALVLLRRAGVLADVAARPPSAGSDMLAELDLLRQLARQPESIAALERGELPADERFRSAFRAWLSRHGHRGVYESDLSRPRYREDPRPVLRSLATRPRPPRSLPPPSRIERALRPLAGHLRSVLRAREELRSAAMLCFERDRAVVLARAESFADDKLLPSPEAIWDLDVDEVLRLDHGFRPDAAFWRSRTAEIEAHRDFVSPDVFRRFDDLEPLQAGVDSGPRTDRLQGVGLTRGEARGRAWVLDEPSVDLPEGFRPEETVLVARAVGWGWIPTFSRVAAVVVEQGGDLSHGSIVLREVGLPSVTGVTGATRVVRTGETLLVRADEGLVVRTEDG